MDSIFRGELSTPRGEALAWIDSLLVDHALLRLAWTNFATVLPGRLYRSNHPTPGRLRAVVRRYGIRTLVNLRGPTGNGSDALSRRQALRLGLHFVDAPLSSGRAPQPEQIRALARAFQDAPEPILVHCKSGADRAGFAAALFLLLEGHSVASVGRHLSWRYGHWRRSRAGVLDAFLQRFATEAEGRMQLLDWVEHRYDPAALQAAFRAGRAASFVATRLLRRE